MYVTIITFNFMNNNKNRLTWLFFYNLTKSAVYKLIKHRTRKEKKKLVKLFNFS